MNLIPLILVMFNFVLVAFSATQEDRTSKEEMAAHAKDFEIFELIDQLHKTTNFKTFYELLGLNSSATLQQINTAFRKKSIDSHPDKTKDPKAEEKFALLSSVATILKSTELRKRYEWLMNEAPAWYKSSFYVKRFVTAKLEIKQVFILFFIFALVAQLIINWTKYFIKLYNKNQAIKTINSLGEKEKKRLAKGSSQDLALTLSLSKIELRKPSFFDLFIFSIPLNLINRLRQKKPHQKKDL